jgi:hypothetical protein
MRSALAATLALALALGAAVAAAAQGEGFLLDDARVRPIAPEALRADPPRFRFAPGERVVWSVSYLGIPVGELRMEVAHVGALEGHRVAHVVATARTNEFFSALYRIDDRSEAWIDLDSLRTLQTATRTRHGRSREVYEEVAFDWENRLIHVLEDKRGKRVRELTIELGPDVYDTFDVIYAIRALPLEAGAKARLPVYAAGKVYALEVEVARVGGFRSEVLGPVEAAVLRPHNLLDGEVQDDGTGEVTFSADARRVPLRLRGWMRAYTGFVVGGLRGDLVAYEPGDPAWPGRGAADAPPRVALPETRDGRVEWRVPPAVAAARARTGQHTRDLRHADRSLEELRACGALAALGRFLAAPGEPGRPAPPCGAEARATPTRPGAVVEPAAGS